MADLNEREIEKLNVIKNICKIYANKEIFYSICEK